MAFLTPHHEDGAPNDYGSDRRYRYLEPIGSGSSVDISTQRMHQRLQANHQRAIERATKGHLTFRGDQLIDTTPKIRSMFGVIQLLTRCIYCDRKQIEVHKMGLNPGQPYICQFTIHDPDTGAAADAASLPTAIATRNGTDDAGFALTVTNMAIGRYKVTGTVPASYVHDDIVQVVVSATVNTIADTAIVDHFPIVEDGAMLGNITDTAATVVSFKIDPAVFPNTSDFAKQSYIRFLNGQNRGIAKPITSYVFSTPDITVTLDTVDALPFAPTNGDRIEIIGFYK